MKGNFWNVLIGELVVDIESLDDPIDATEAGTRAIEHLHLVKTDYRIGPTIIAVCENKRIPLRSDVVLANAGKFKQCEKLLCLIREHNEKIKKKPLA
jgi:hypothetical protein